MSPPRPPAPPAPRRRPPPGPPRPPARRPRRGAGPRLLGALEAGWARIAALPRWKAVAVLAAGALAIVWAMQALSRATVTAPPPARAPSGPPPGLEPDSAGARLAGQARSLLARVPAVRTDVRSPRRLTVAWSSGWLTAVPASGPARAADRSGRAYVRSGSCFAPAGKAARASAAGAVLPLSQPGVRFARPEQDGDVTVVRFDARRLGSWGKGAGQVSFKAGAPVAFSYRPYGAPRAALLANVTYPPGPLPAPRLCRGRGRRAR